MRFRKIIGFGALSLMLIGALISCGTSTSNNTTTDGNISNNQITNITGTIDETMFKSGDTKLISESDYDQTINLSSLTDNYTIDNPGTYHVIGSSNDYQLIINYNDVNEKNVHLVLDNVTMTNSLNACIYVKDAEKVVIHLVGDNTITSTYTAGVIDGTSTIDGAIHSKDDLTITGDGKLTVNSKLHGIVCKNDLKFTGGTININSSSKGIDANDSVRIKDSIITINATSDGIHLENSTNDSFFYMESGELNITSSQDGISANTSETSFTGYINIVGGTINLTTGGGYTKNPSSNISSKGIKSDNIINISGGIININSSDDSIHASSIITISNGYIVLKSADDCIHSDTKVIINDGTINCNSHEGIEGKTVEINGGNITIVASDDGINASNNITVNGGYIDITMGNGDVDGIDSNGTFTQTGGYIIARVANVNEMAAPLDTDGSVSITGGTFIALGYFNTSNSRTSIPSVSYGSYSFGVGNRGFNMGGNPMGGGFGGGTSSVTFQAGTYTVSNTDISFTLTGSYQALTIVSDKLSTGNSYTLYKDGSEYKTWTQSSLSVSAS